MAHDPLCDRRVGDCRDGQGRRYNIEVQFQDQSAYTKRSLCYLTRLYNEQLGPGDGYEALKKTVGISLLEIVLFPDLDDLQSIFRMHDVEHAHTRDDHLEMHCIEINKFQVDKPHALRSPFEKWLHILKFGDTYEEGLESLPEVLSSEEGIVMALNAMQRARMSDEVREMMEIRERAAHDEATRLERAVREAEGVAEGVAEGEARGVREAARRMLAAGMDRDVVLRTLGLPADMALP